MDTSPAPAQSAAEPSLPQVGVVAAWFDPEDPRPYSGLPFGVISEFRRLGIYAGYRNITPWSAPSRALWGWMGLTRRRDWGWTLSPEMRLLSRLSDASRARQAPEGIDGWVHFVGGHGRGVKGHYVTLFDMSPSQLLSTSERWGESWGYPEATRSRMEWVIKRQKTIYDGAYACCVPSRWGADSLVRDHAIAANRVHVVGCGINATAAEPAERDWSTPRFLFVGRDWVRKNGDAIVRAFIKLRESVPGARLDLVGRHPEINVEGVVGHGHIAVDDPIERTKLEALFAAATCFVMPSLIEPFGIVYVEAGAVGVPSIGTTIGGTTDSIGDGGLVVDPYDDEALLVAMRTMCDPDTARAYGARAYERSSLFTWEKAGQRVYRSLDLGDLPGVELAEPL